MNKLKRNLLCCADLMSFATFKMNDFSKLGA